MKKNNELVLLFSLIFIALLLISSDLLTIIPEIKSENVDTTYLDMASVSRSINEDTNIISDQLNYYKENYNVNINVYDIVENLNISYQLETIKNSNVIISSLNQLGTYFSTLGSDLFNNFYKYNMQGLEIYLVSEIKNKDKADSNNADIVGLFFKKNNKYMIIIKVNSNENIVNIAFHETMHAIEEYLKMHNEFFVEWDSLNPKDFSYSQTFYTNQIFSDTIDGNKYYSEVYFIDNYARSSAMEDRARIFEYLCLGINLQKYPNLAAKATYLQQTLQKYI